MIKGNFQTRVVTIGDRELSPELSQKIRLHSPDGFMWGYSGSGPSQLALALLLEFMPTRQEEAKDLYQTFKQDVIARLPQEDFELNEDVILDWINLHAFQENKESQN